jgi:hypothetical protein
VPRPVSAVVAELLLGGVDALHADTRPVMSLLTPKRCREGSRMRTEHHVL